jgi:hypothetical protein
MIGKDTHSAGKNVKQGAKLLKENRRKVLRSKKSDNEN